MHSDIVKVGRLRQFEGSGKPQDSLGFAITTSSILSSIRGSRDTRAGLTGARGGSYHELVMVAERSSTL
jgi:hypothetical protein